MPFLDLFWMLCKWFPLPWQRDGVALPITFWFTLDKLGGGRAALTKVTSNMTYGQAWEAQPMRIRAEHETLMMGLLTKMYVFTCLNKNLAFVFTFLQGQCTWEKRFVFHQDVPRSPFPIPVAGRLPPAFMSYTDSQFSEFNFKILNRDLS